MLLVRPYPVHLLAEARAAMERLHHDDLAPLQKLYREAAAALSDIDPDEVDEFRQEFPRAVRDDQALARAAGAVADTWEGIVAIASMVSNRDRFRGFLWLCAQVRYELEPARRDAGRLRAYADGAHLPAIPVSDEALYVALPALMGLGPELPDEIEGEIPFPHQPVTELLGLPTDDDWAGVDPLDGWVISPEACRAHYAAAPPAWRDALGRGLERGLLVRAADAEGSFDSTS